MATATSELGRNPQKVLGALRPNPARVFDITDHYRQLSRPSFQNTPAKIGQDIRSDALMSARVGNVQQPLDFDSVVEDSGIPFLADVFAAGEQIGIKQTEFTTKEKLDYVADAALTGAVRLLSLITNPRIADDLFKFGISSMAATEAKKMIDLRFDGFSYEAMEKVYFPRFKHQKSHPNKVGQDIQNREFYQLLRNVAEGNYSGNDEIFKTLSAYESRTGHTLTPELLIAFHTLHNIEVAESELKRFFMRSQNLARDEDITPVIPEDESGEAYQLLVRAKDCMLAKVESIAVDEYKIDFSNWFTF